VAAKKWQRLIAVQATPIVPDEGPQAANDNAMAGFNLMTQQGLFWLWSAQKHAPPVLCQQCPHAPLGRQLRTAGPSTSAGENPQRPKSKSLERLTISPTVRIRNDQLRHKCLRFGQSHADGKAKPSGIGVESRDRTTSAVTVSKPPAVYRLAA
jgi:hypothetical protein